ncbi:hypothetical protein B0H13DRAFT_2285362 [Mycena leptocephala]|nr:hypothetical protein B0H13DRAFT_2285362 [Mycena leptocephala]
MPQPHDSNKLYSFNFVDDFSEFTCNYQIMPWELLQEDGSFGDQERCTAEKAITVEPDNKLRDARTVETAERAKNPEGVVVERTKETTRLGGKRTMELFACHMRNAPRRVWGASVTPSLSLACTSTSTDPLPLPLTNFHFHYFCIYSTHNHGNKNSEESGGGRKGTGACMATVHWPCTGREIRGGVEIGSRAGVGVLLAGGGPFRIVDGYLPPQLNFWYQNRLWRYACDYGARSNFGGMARLMCGMLLDARMRVDVRFIGDVRNVREDSDQIHLLHHALAVCCIRCAERPGGLLIRFISYIMCSPSANDKNHGRMEDRMAGVNNPPLSLYGAGAEGGGAVITDSHTAGCGLLHGWGAGAGEAREFEATVHAAEHEVPIESATATARCRKARAQKTRRISDTRHTTNAANKRSILPPLVYSGDLHYPPLSGQPRILVGFRERIEEKLKPFACAAVPRPRNISLWKSRFPPHTHYLPQGTTQATVNCDVGEIQRSVLQADEETLTQTIHLANIASRDLTFVGSHPSLPDRQGFGRREIAMEPVKPQIDPRGRLFAQFRVQIDFGYGAVGIAGVVAAIYPISNIVLSGRVNFDSTCWNQIEKEFDAGRCAFKIEAFSMAENSAFSASIAEEGVTFEAKQKQAVQQQEEIEKRLLGEWSLEGTLYYSPLACLGG